MATLPEFRTAPTALDALQRTAPYQPVAYVAVDGDIIVAAKLGYWITSDTFYSWLGGVTPSHRRQHIAQTLLDIQHQHIRAHGGATVRVKTMNRYPAMLHLLIRNRYQIVAVEHDHENTKIVFEHHLEH